MNVHLSSLHLSVFRNRNFIYSFQNDSIHSGSYEASVWQLLKGFLDGCKSNEFNRYISDMEMKEFFLSIQQFLYYGNCSQNVDAVQSLSMLSAYISLTEVGY